MLYFGTKLSPSTRSFPFSFPPPPQCAWPGWEDLWFHTGCKWILKEREKTEKGFFFPYRLSSNYDWSREAKKNVPDISYWSRPEWSKCGRLSYHPGFHSAKLANWPTNHDTVQSIPIAVAIDRLVVARKLSDNNNFPLLPHWSIVNNSQIGESRRSLSEAQVDFI